jgi:dihydrofolate reductase
LIRWRDGFSRIWVWPTAWHKLIAADALILGRKTYKKLADFWPKSDDEWAELINPMPKHVASRTLEGPLTWNSQLLGADIAGEVANLKSR